MLTIKKLSKITTIGNKHRKTYIISLLPQQVDIGSDMEKKPKTKPRMNFNTYVIINKLFSTQSLVCQCSLNLNRSKTKNTLESVLRMNQHRIWGGTQHEAGIKYTHSTQWVKLHKRQTLQGRGRG
jgi:hypothetical protein